MPLANSDFDELLLASALWDLRTLVGEGRADRLVATALKATRRGGKADAFADALIRVSGDGVDSVRDVLRRHEVDLKK
jgi:hypothetical protein